MLRRTQPNNLSNPRRIRLVISLEEGRGKDRKYIKSRSGSFEQIQGDNKDFYKEALNEVLEEAMKALEARWGR